MTPTMTAAELVALANSKAGRECWPPGWQAVTENPLWTHVRVTTSQHWFTLGPEELYRLLLGGAVLRLGEMYGQYDVDVLEDGSYAVMCALSCLGTGPCRLTACIAAIAAGMEKP